MQCEETSTVAGNSVWRESLMPSITNRTARPAPPAWPAAALGAWLRTARCKQGRLLMFSLVMHCTGSAVTSTPPVRAGERRAARGGCELRALLAVGSDLSAQQPHPAGPDSKA